MSACFDLYVPINIRLCCCLSTEVMCFVFSQGQKFFFSSVHFLLFCLHSSIEEIFAMFIAIAFVGDAVKGTVKSKYTGF